MSLPSPSSGQKPIRPGRERALTLTVVGARMNCTPVPPELAS
jgi:hypothetical protein